MRLLLGMTTKVSGFSYAISISVSVFFTYRVNNPTFGFSQFDWVFIYFQMSEILLEYLVLSLCNNSIVSL